MGVFPFPMPFSGPPKFGSFSPLALFAASEPGGWYDPSDLSTLFQDAAGTTPVTAVEQPVGLVLDKSKGLVLGSELVTNGGFDTDTAWTKGSGWSIGSGTATRTATGAQSFLEQAGTVENGKFYRVSFTVTAFTAGDVGIRLGANTAANLITATTTGTYTGTVQCTAAGGAIVFRASSGFAGTIDNISVRELPGNHLSQSTSTARPVLSARVNLLTYTEQFDNAAWTKDGLLAFGSGSTANATTAPDGTSTADLITEDTTTGNHRVFSENASVANVACRYSVSVKKASGSRYVGLRALTVSASSSYAHCIFDLSNQTYSASASVSSPSITPQGDDWYRISMTVTGDASNRWLLYLSDTATAPAESANGVSYAGNGTSGIYIWGADLRPSNAGVGLPAYQRVGAAVSGTSGTASPPVSPVTGVPDYDTTGFPLYLRFDGTDDFLVSGTINPGSVDKAQVFAGVRKLSDAARGMIVEANTSYAVSGTFGITAPDAASASYGFFLNGSQITGSQATAYTSPITNILSVCFDIGASTRVEEVIPAINGQLPTVSGQGAPNAGTGNFVSSGIYVGRRGGTSLPFNGQLYSLIVRFSATNMDAATIASTETWVNSKTRAY